MAMIFGRFSLMTDDLREAFFEISHVPKPGQNDDFESRIFAAAEQLYQAAASIEPAAHFSTLERAIKELAWEASEAGLLDAGGSQRASLRMLRFGLEVHPKPTDGPAGIVQKRPLILLSDGLSHIDRWKRAEKVSNERER
jgi:hypothetical protein|tara:strand:+ start:756 stop:1175 length:420 start_codon:yes stop_codon:yes gene_type:complete